MKKISGYYNEDFFHSRKSTAKHTDSFIPIEFRSYPVGVFLLCVSHEGLVEGKDLGK